MGGDKKDAAQEKEVDIFRDTSLRYTGYCNEVGEAFRNLAPRFVRPSYAISIAYVMADTASKAQAAEKPLATATDVFTWQMAASVIVPGVAINCVVKAATVGLKYAAGAPAPVKKWLPTLLGLGAIPLIITPIDDFVHKGMDLTIRPYLHASEVKKQV